MPIVKISHSLIKELIKRFPKEKAQKAIDVMESLEKEPHKGKLLGVVGSISIKELKFEGFRFYFIFDGFTLQTFDEEKLVNLLFQFVRMSNKKEQQKTINEIKNILRKIGPSGLK